jgi:hypothetical protein
MWGDVNLEDTLLKRKCSGMVQRRAHLDHKGVADHLHDYDVVVGLHQTNLGAHYHRFLKKRLPCDRRQILSTALLCDAAGIPLPEALMADCHRMSRQSQEGGDVPEGEGAARTGRRPRWIWHWRATPRPTRWNFMPSFFSWGMTSVRMGMGGLYLLTRLAV